MLAPSKRKRRGLTLLEVIVSLAIFLFSLIAISELVNFGTDRALDARHYQQATSLCQSKLAEITTGSLPLESQGDSTFEDGGLEWTWSSTCDQQGDVPDLWKVAVTVSRPSGYGQTVSVTLSQLLMEPSCRGSTYDAPPQQNAALDPNYAPSGSSGKNDSSSKSNSGSKTGGNTGTNGGKKGTTGGGKTGGTTGGSKIGGTPGGKTGGTPAGGATGGTKTGGTTGGMTGGTTGGTPAGTTGGKKG